MDQSKPYLFAKMMNKLALYFPTTMSSEKIEAYWDLLKEYSIPRLEKAMESVAGDKSDPYFPTVARIIEHMPNYTYGMNENVKAITTGKILKYRFSDLEMLWFSLNAKYAGHCNKNKETWMFSERNARVIEWSKGAIDENNISEIRNNYESYAKSGDQNNRRFNYKEFTDTIFTNKQEKTVR